MRDKESVRLAAEQAQGPAADRGPGSSVYGIPFICGPYLVPGLITLASLYGQRKLRHGV